MASVPLHSPTVMAPWYRSRVPMLVILAVAFLIHAPLLLMQLPLGSYDGNFHVFFASHYAEHWFDPWNPKWYAGFSQTTYPPLPHQWMALVSPLIGLKMAYMLVQFVAIALLALGMYRFARLWVDERSASYAALASVFLGSLALLVYQAGQLSTTLAAPLYLLALPYFHEWAVEARAGALLKGLALITTAAAAHHATLIFGAVLFALPVFWLAIVDRNRGGVERSTAAVVSRSAVFAALAVLCIAIVLLPFWIALLNNPVDQTPIPHASRANYLLHPMWGVNYFLIPYGALLLAIPFVIWRGAVSSRLRPLLIFFWLAFLLGLGGTTPIPRWLLLRAHEVITYERFSFWATLLALPLVGLLAAQLLERFRRAAAVGLVVAAVATFATGVAWTSLNPLTEDTGLRVREVAAFLNRDGHDRYRYLTLGFGRKIAELATLTNASTVDGEWNSARQLPELTQHGAAQFTNAKYFGTAGIESLKAILKHADQYGLKWVFLRDPYYEPLLVFGGWRKVDSLQRQSVSIWSKDGVPPAQPVQFAFRPPAWHGLLWGILPIGASVLTILLLALLPERRSRPEVAEMPTPVTEPVYARGGK